LRARQNPYDPTDSHGFCRLEEKLRDSEGKKTKIGISTMKSGIFVVFSRSFATNPLARSKF